MQKIIISALTLTAVLNLSVAKADEYTYSPQLAQDGITQALQAYAKYGKGVTIGIVDTGLNASHNEVVGRVSTQSTCVATGNCAQGFTDTFGHGTFVASIAAGAQNNYGMVGVASQATILSVKIAQASGSAYTTDENTGIRTAADRGAQVINLSYGSFLGPKDTASYAYYNAQLVSAINYAASKGATIVIAAGNSGTTFMGNVDATGFTAAALNHLVIVGSVNSKNILSSFSNTAGTSNFVDTTGKKTTLDNLWIMAPGENLIGAYYQSATGYAQGSGTSFSAPQVAGAIALLDARWPVLYRNGTSSQVLLQGATDLGTKGVDTTYGVGLMNLNQAFLPVGNLNIINAKGQNVNATTITGSTLSSGAFGSLNSIKSVLSNMTAFDTYQRDYSLNLSGLIATKPSSGTVALPSGPQVIGSKYHFADGSAAGFGEMSDDLSAPRRDDNLPVQQKSWYMSMTSSDQSTVAAGYGFPASASFAEALWGSNSHAGKDIDTLGISNGLLNLAQGGVFTAYGAQIDEDTRIAASWVQTPTTASPLASTSTVAKASAFGVGVTSQLSKTWKAGFTFNSLNETDGLLGSTYANSPVGFGDHHTSMSLGISSAFNLGTNSELLLDAAMVHSDGADISNGLITHVSDIYARSMGASYVERDSFKDGDRFSVSVRKPLQVYSGSATLATTSVDSQGYATVNSQKVGLQADGSETDIGATYAAPWKMGVNWTASIEDRHEADNTKGQDAATFMLGAKLSF